MFHGLQIGEVFQTPGALHGAENHIPHNAGQRQGSLHAASVFCHSVYHLRNYAVLLRVREPKILHHPSFDMVGHHNHDYRGVRRLLPRVHLWLFSRNRLCHVRNHLPHHSDRADSGDVQRLLHTEPAEGAVCQEKEETAQNDKRMGGLTDFRVKLHLLIIE